MAKITTTDSNTIMALLEKGLIPVDDDVWKSIIECSLSYIKTEPLAMPLAHHAATRNLIPKDGSLLYQIKDDEGFTAAHVAAAHGYLPEDFNQWELCNNSGWTVAHEAARHNGIPEGFTQWELTTTSGVTVREVYEKYKK